MTEQQEPLQKQKVYGYIDGFNLYHGIDDLKDTADNDLAPVISIITQKVGKEVVALIPPEKTQWAHIKSASSSVKRIKAKDIKACQLPEEIITTDGKITRPPHYIKSNNQ